MGDIPDLTEQLKAELKKLEEMKIEIQQTYYAVFGIDGVLIEIPIQASEIRGVEGNADD